MIASSTGTHGEVGKWGPASNGRHKLTSPARPKRDGGMHGIRRRRQTRARGGHRGRDKAETEAEEMRRARMHKTMSTSAFA